MQRFESFLFISQFSEQSIILQKELHRYVSNIDFHRNMSKRAGFNEKMHPSWHLKKPEEPACNLSVVTLLINKCGQL